MTFRFLTTDRRDSGAGLNIPIWILGSSLYSAQLAGALGLPYAFAGHFAPDDMIEAFNSTAPKFKPSLQLKKPYVAVGVQAVVADTSAHARFLASSLYVRFLE